MPFLSDNIRDNGLQYGTTNINRVDICSQEPANYTERGTYSVGNKTGVSVGSPENGDVNGRKIVVAAITDGVVTDDAANGSHWAASYTGNTELVAASSLASAQTVYVANGFTLAAINITIPD